MAFKVMNLPPSKNSFEWWKLNKYFFYLIILILAGCDDEGCNALVDRNVACTPLDIDNFEAIPVDHAFKFKVQDLNSGEICDNFTVRIKYKFYSLKDCDIFTDPNGIGLPYVKEAGEYFKHYTDGAEYHTIEIGDGFDYYWEFDYLPMRITIQGMGEVWDDGDYTYFYQLNEQKRNNLNDPKEYHIFKKKFFEQ